MLQIEYRCGDYTVSTDKSRLDMNFVRPILQNTYWDQSCARYREQRAIANSICFGLYKESTQLGFARVISDFATFAYLTDVYLNEAARGCGLEEWLFTCILEHPDLYGMRRWLLATADARRLYWQHSPVSLRYPDSVLELYQAAHVRHR